MSDQTEDMKIKHSYTTNDVAYQIYQQSGPFAYQQMYINLTMHYRNVPIVRRNQDFVEDISNFTTFPSLAVMSATIYN